MGISWLAIAGARRVTAVVDQRSSFNLLTFAGCLSFRYVITVAVNVALPCTCDNDSRLRRLSIDLADALCCLDPPQ